MEPQDPKLSAFIGQLRFTERKIEKILSDFEKEYHVAISGVHVRTNDMMNASGKKLVPNTGKVTIRLDI